MKVRQWCHDDDDARLFHTSGLGSFDSVNNHGMSKQECWFRPRFPTQSLPKSQLLPALFGHLRPQKPKPLLSRACRKKIMLIHDRKPYFVVILSAHIYKKVIKCFFKNTSQVITTACKANRDFVKIKQIYF